MVYVDPKNLGYMPFWEKWVNERQSKAEQEDLKKLFEKYVPSCIDLILEGVIDGKPGEKLKNIVPLTNLNMVSGIMADILWELLRQLYFINPRRTYQCLFTGL